MVWTGVSTDSGMFHPKPGYVGLVKNLFQISYDYLHPAQDEEEQPPHPEPLEDDDGLLEDLPIPKRDMSFSVFFEPHFSQTT